MNEPTLQMNARFDRTLVRQHHASVRYLVVEATAGEKNQRKTFYSQCVRFRYGKTSRVVQF